MLYTLGIKLYGLGIRLAAMRPGKARLLHRGQHDVWQHLQQNIVAGERYVWVHAASLGEFEQGRPLIERIRAEQPDKKILLTFFSPSGYEVRKNYTGADVVAYLPLDTRRNVRRFLDITNPEIAIFVKYEFWANYLKELKRREIPTYLISAIFRPGQLFFKPWGGWYRGLLHCFDHIYVQDEGSRKLLESAGYTDVTVAGDTRFDRVTDIMRTTTDLPEIEQFIGAERPFVFIVGSSWPQDEEVYMPWLLGHPEVTALIAPHEFDDARLQKLTGLLGARGALLKEDEKLKIKDKTVSGGGEDEKLKIKDKTFSGGGEDENLKIEDKTVSGGGEDEKLKIKDKTSDTISKNQKLKTKNQPNILIINCFGILSSLYRYGDMAYVGGGFGAGIHNINEAAVYGIPVIYGPNNKKFLEAQELAQCGGGRAINSQREFEQIADLWLADAKERERAGEAAGAYIQGKLGATDIVYRHLFKKN